jgi:hypothetical protein
MRGDTEQTLEKFMTSEDVTLLDSALGKDLNIYLSGLLFKSRVQPPIDNPGCILEQTREQRRNKL